MCTLRDDVALRESFRLVCLIGAVKRTMRVQERKLGRRASSHPYLQAQVTTLRWAHSVALRTFCESRRAVRHAR